jgi:acid phosphatase (class A)
MKISGLLKSASGLFRQLPLALLAALALGACAHKPPQAIAPERRSSAAEAVYYAAPEPFKNVQFAPPPAPDSAEQQADLAGVLAWQNKRTEADCAKSARTAKEDYDAYWGGRSVFPGEVPQEFKDFFARVSADFEFALDEMKARFKRPRPFMAYPGDAVPCIKKSKSFSYPSGHSSAARVTAAVLADLAPERRGEFYAKADEIALDRLIGGVHYPADIAAGKAFGDLFHAELLKSPAYRGDLEKLKGLLSK